MNNRHKGKIHKRKEKYVDHAMIDNLINAGAWHWLGKTTNIANKLDELFYFREALFLP